MTCANAGEQTNGDRRVERASDRNVWKPKSQQSVVAEGAAAMTLKQARKRFPLVPEEILRWALENINDPDDLERGLFRLEEAKRLQLKYSA